MSKFIQFKGIDDVLQAYENRKVNAWAIFSGRQFINKGLDKATLEAFLMLLEESTETYTLKVYEDVNTTKLIKEKTECDGSFNFVLTEPEPYQRGGFSEKVSREIAELKRELILQREQNYEEDEPKGFLGQIDKYLSDPVRMQNVVQTIGIVRSIFTGNPEHALNSVRALGHAPAAAAQIPVQPGSNGNNTVTAAAAEKPMNAGKSESQILFDAIARLSAIDRDLPKHLTLLADYADKDINSFMVLLQSIEML